MALKSGQKRTGRLEWVFVGLIFFTVFMIIPLPGIKYPARVVFSTTMLMGIWWVSEAIPISATALVPLVMFPLLGVSSAKEAAIPYANHNIFLFMGGFFIAKAMERHLLHKRIALRIMTYVGTAKRRIILGFMVATAFLSMWISNTASTMIMLPIAMAVMHKMDAEGKPFATALFLGIAYSASVGGVGTLVGTPPNIVLTGQMHSMFPKGPQFTFASWLPVGLSVTVLMIPIIWIYLTFFAFKMKEGKRVSRDFLRNELAAMGKMSYNEWVVFFVFLLVALGWIFRKNLNLGFVQIPGWSNLLGNAKTVQDSTVAMLGALLLFLIPAGKGGRILEWKTAVQIPWGIVLLFGGGFSIAAAFNTSGLAGWVGETLKSLGGMNPIMLILVICAVMTFLTEITSNTATASLMLPLLGSVALGLNHDPRLLMVPATMADSCAFMLPVGTPPNAIVFGSGQIKIRDMVKTGVVINLLGIAIVFLVVYFIAIPLLGINLQEAPLWTR